MKRISVLGAALLLSVLTACVPLPPPGQAPQEEPQEVVEAAPESSEPTPEPTTTPVATPVAEPPAPEPAQPSTPTFTPDEDTFLEMASVGLVYPFLIYEPSLSESMLEAGWSICTSIDAGASRAEILNVTTIALADPTVFTPDMPAIFVAAAESYLCGEVAQ